jgi:hypothetical protein
MLARAFYCIIRLRSACLGDLEDEAGGAKDAKAEAKEAEEVWRRGFLIRGFRCHSGVALYPESTVNEAAALHRLAETHRDLRKIFWQNRCCWLQSGRGEASISALCR